MSRPTLVALSFGLVGAIAIFVMGLGGTPVMPSYLGAWLFILALPLGALPLVMASELIGLPETRVVSMLRRLVAVTPLAALLAIPVLLHLDALYPSLAVAKSGLPGWWMTDVGVVMRSIVVLVVWTALAVVFARPRGSGLREPRRRRLAGLGLALHAIMGTLAAADWAQAVEPSFVSSAFGLTLIAAQCSIAGSLAVVMAAMSRSTADVVPVGRHDREAGVHAGTALAGLLGAWGFLVFTQYLVAWSANLPKEVVWYQHRAEGLGLAAESSTAVLCMLTLVALLTRGLSRHAGVVASAAAALLVMHALEMLWLVTPAFRSAFTLTPADGVALAGAAGLGIGVALLVGERSDRGRAGHGEA